VQKDITFTIPVPPNKYGNERKEGRKEGRQRGREKGSEGEREREIKNVL
jgi:hypothetical protein